MAEFPLEFLLQVKNEMSAGLTQATSQLKAMGSEAASSAGKVKQSGLGIGASISLITTTLVSTANSIISLKRQWEDLTRAQNDVVQSHNTLLNKQDAVTKATINLAAAEKGGGKASALDLKIAHTELAAAIDKYGKGSIQAAKAQSSLNKLLGKGGVDTDKVTKAQLALNKSQRNLTNAKISDKEVTVNLQRATEDFYLQTIPTAIGVIGSGASVFQVFQKSGIGLGSSLTKLAIPLGAIALAALAIKTNFLGVQDFLNNLGRDLGNQVPALKPFLSVLREIGELLGLVPPEKGRKPGGGLTQAITDLKKQFGPLMDFFKGAIDDIMKGNWTGVFNRVIEAAKVAWRDIKIAFPLLGDIESFINKIGAGNWKGALLQIWVAAKYVWGVLKTTFPLLADVETVVNDIKEGKWGEAFQKIADTAKTIFNATLGKGIEFLFGKNWISGLDAFLKLQESEASLKNRPLILQYAVTINGAIKAITGFDIMAWFAAHPLTVTGLPISLNGITLLVDDAGYRDSVLKGALIIWNALADAATSLDLDVSKWIKSIDFSGKDFIDSVNAAGEAIWKGIEDGMGTAASDTDWGKIFNNAILAIFKSKTAGAVGGAVGETPLAQFLKALGFGEGKGPLNVTRTKYGVELNPLVDLAKWGYEIQKALGLIHPEAKVFVNDDPIKAWESTVKPLQLPTDLNTEPAKKTGGAFKNQIERQKYIAQMGLETKKADQSLKGFTNKVNNTTATMKLNLAWGPGSVNSISRQLQNVWGGRSAAGGMHETLSKDTMIQAHAGERVDIGKGGGGPTTIIVQTVLDGRVVAESVARQISVNQAVYR